MEFETAVDEVDGILEGLAMALSSETSRIAASGEIVNADEIAHRLIDEHLGSAEDSLKDVFNALTEDDDPLDEDDAAKREAADAVLDDVIDELNQELWEFIESYLTSMHDDLSQDMLDDIREVLLQHREALMTQVDRLAPTPPSTSSETDTGVVLPIARRRR